MWVLAFHFERTPIGSAASFAVVAAELAAAVQAAAERDKMDPLWRTEKVTKAIQRKRRKKAARGRVTMG